MFWRCLACGSIAVLLTIGGGCRPDYADQEVRDAFLEFYSIETQRYRT